MERAEGITPAAIKVLADYLIGEVVSIVWDNRPDGRQAARVHFYDYEARELNDAPDEPGKDHQEYFTHYYFFADDGSRVVEIRDTDQNLIEKDPIPWPLQEVLNGPRHRGTPGPRSRVSGLAADRVA